MYMKVNVSKRYVYTVFELLGMIGFMYFIYANAQRKTVPNNILQLSCSYFVIILTAVLFLITLVKVIFRK